MSSEHPKPPPTRDPLQPGRLRPAGERAKAKVLAVCPELWCEAVMAGHDVIMGYRIRDRAGQRFGFAYKRRAAWEDAWRRIRADTPPERPGDGAAAQPGPR